jgi:hypothetical protein
MDSYAHKALVLIREIRGEKETSCRKKLKKEVNWSNKIMECKI